MSSISFVEACLERELAQRGDGPAAAAALHPVTSALRHRALLEDQTEHRRTRTLNRVGASTDVLPLELGQHGPGRTAGPDSTIGARDDLLSALIESDLPDTGGENLRNVRNALATFSVFEPTMLTIDEVQGYLDGRADLTGSKVHALTRLTGGFSKETVKVSLTTPRDQAAIVLRLLVPGRMSRDLPLEYEVVRFVWEQGGVPVPEPLWLEIDESKLGRVFSVSRFVEGHSVGDAYGPSRQAQRSIGLELAAILARLHALDARVLASKPLPHMVSRTQMMAAVERQWAALERATRGQDEHAIYLDLWRAVLDWLSAHVPPDVDDPVLVHGDIGFHNLLVSDNRVAGLFDWEHAHVGQREEDLAYVRPRIAGLLEWPEFLAAYADAGGTNPDSERLRFHAVWQDTRNGLVGLERRRIFFDESHHLADAVIGMLLTPLHLRAALRTMYDDPT